MNKMKISFLAVSILLLSYGICAAQPVEPGTLFGAAHDFCRRDGAGPSTLYLVDPDNGNTTVIGPIGFSGVSGLAFLPDDRLVGSAKADDNGDRISILIEIDPNTGQGTLIAQIGNSNIPGQCGRVPDLTYDPFNDILLGLGDRCSTVNDDRLLNINPDSGVGTAIGETGFTGGGNGLAIVNNKVMYSVNSVNLLTINRVTGKGTFIADIGHLMSALAFNALTGQLFGSGSTGNDNNLYTIDTPAGTVDFIGELPNCFDALVFAPSPLPLIVVPTLCEWGLIAMAGFLGIISLMAIRRTKITA